MTNPKNDIVPVIRRTFENALFTKTLSLSNSLGRPITVFSLNTSSSQPKGDFGITEMAFLRFYKGEIVNYTSLINPESKIDYFSESENGIAREHVYFMDNWKKSGLASYFSKAMKTGAICSFNGEERDFEALLAQQKRYRMYADGIAHSLDIQKACRNAFGDLDDLDDLKEYFERLKLEFPKAPMLLEHGWDRAGRQALAAAMVMEKCCGKLGLSQMKKLVRGFDLGVENREAEDDAWSPRH